MTQAKLRREVVADLVGDYLFTDQSFVERLSVEHRDVFDRIFDEVKYLCRIATAGSKEARQLEKVKKAFEKAYRVDVKNTVLEDGVMYALAKVEDVTPSNEQKNENIREVAEMQSVYTVDSAKLIPGEKSIKETYQKYFTEWGGNIHSDVFGDIAVKNSSMRSEMRHGSTPVKVASIEAIPSVIQNGKIVEWIEKNTGLFRIVVAAPIKIGEKPYYMGVMLQRDAQNQRLYIHDVVIEEEVIDSSQEHLDSTGPYEENENLYVSSILDKIVEVKRKKESIKQKNALSVDGEDFAPIRGGVYSRDILLEGKESDAAQDIAPEVEPGVAGDNADLNPELRRTIQSRVDGLAERFAMKDMELREKVEDKSRFTRLMAAALQEELDTMLPGDTPSKHLKELMDRMPEYSGLHRALLTVFKNPDAMTEYPFKYEQKVREYFDSVYDQTVEQLEVCSN